MEAFCETSNLFMGGSIAVHFGKRLGVCGASPHKMFCFLDSPRTILVHFRQLRVLGHAWAGAVLRLLWVWISQLQYIHPSGAVIHNY